MAFDMQSLVHVTGQVAGHKMFGYTTSADTLAEVATANYFASASHLMAVGDLVKITASDGYGLTIINQNDGSVIDCANIIDLNAADTA